MKDFRGFSIGYLNEVFAYNPDTGVVVRRIKRAQYDAGSVVGTLDGKGYLHVNLNGKFLLLHRLVYFLHCGEVPTYIDHINRIKTDNRLKNLRAANQSQNAGNSGTHSHNTSGFRGVSYSSRYRLWAAQIKINGKQTYLGRYETAEEAARVYNAAALHHFGMAFATLNDV